MSRAVLLGTGAFPFILRLWLECFKIWQDEIDILYIAIDHYSEPTSRDYIVNLVKQFPRARLLENASGWPSSYRDAYLQSKEDSFLIMHDDALVHKKGIVDKYFKIAEKGKVVTPMHGIYEPRAIVDQALKEKYGESIPYPYSFLLYFLFISRKNLEKTSIDFNGIGWEAGQDIPLLGIKNAPASIAGDTGWITCLELFAKQVPFHPIPRSETAQLAHEHEDVITLLEQWKNNKEGIFKEGWLHLQNTGNTIPLWFHGSLDDRIWHKNIEEVRLAWMYVMLQIEDYSEIPEFKKKANEIFDGVVLRCDADSDRIKKIASIFTMLLFNKE